MPKGFQKGNQEGRKRKVKQRVNLFDARQYCEENGVDIVKMFLEVINEGTLNGKKQDEDAPLMMLKELAKYVLVQRKAVDLTSEGDKDKDGPVGITINLVG